MYSPHSGAVGLSNSNYWLWSKQWALPHSTNEYLFCLLFLSHCLPQKENYIFTTPLLTGKTYTYIQYVCRKNWCLGNCVWNTGWRNSITRRRANSKQNGDWKTSNEVPLPARCDWHFHKLEEVFRTCYSVQIVPVWFEKKEVFAKIVRGVLLLTIYGITAPAISEWLVHCSGLAETEYG